MNDHSEWDSDHSDTIPGFDESYVYRSCAINPFSDSDTVLQRTQSVVNFKNKSMVITVFFSGFMFIAFANGRLF